MWTGLSRKHRLLLKMWTWCQGCPTHVHGEDAARDELPVLPDGEVPRLDPHQIIEGKLQYQTSLCTNLDRDETLSLTFRLICFSDTANQPAQSCQPT